MRRAAVPGTTGLRHDGPEDLAQRLRNFRAERGRPLMDLRQLDPALAEEVREAGNFDMPTTLEGAIVEFFSHGTRLLLR